SIDQLIPPRTMSATLRAGLAIVLSLFAWAATCATAAAAEHVPRELVVKYRAGTTGPERDAIRQAAGVRTAGTIDGSTQTVEVPGSESSDEAAAKLKADPRVVHAVPNYVATATAFTPNDPGRGTPGQWAQLQWNFTGPFGIDAPDAWQNAINAGDPGGRGV